MELYASLNCADGGPLGQEMSGIGDWLFCDVAFPATCYTYDEYCSCLECAPVSRRLLQQRAFSVKRAGLSA